jgi:cytochrome bd-type quinol oxidase subunit 1
MENKLKERWNAKTPKFWKKVRNIAITVGAVSGVILTAPISLPATVITAASYLATVGTVAATLSQLTVENKQDDEESI